MKTSVSPRAGDLTRTQGSLSFMPADSTEPHTFWFEMFLLITLVSYILPLVVA